MFLIVEIQTIPLYKTRFYETIILRNKAANFVLIIRTDITGKKCVHIGAYIYKTKETAKMPL